MSIDRNSSFSVGLIESLRHGRAMINKWQEFALGEVEPYHPGFMQDLVGLIEQNRWR
jgi:hypothetical protein